MIPSLHASRVARVAAGGGVTPNAVNWADVSFGQETQTAMLQITGITSTITLRATFSTNNPNSYNQKYSVQSSASFGTGTAIASNGTFTVSNNQYLGFSSQSGGGYGMTTSWTITNVSDSNALIDSFTTTANLGSIVSEE